MSYTQLGTPCDTESTELVPVVEGDNLWLVCEHSANPAPTVYWLAGAEIASHEEELLLTNITRDSPRLYTCIAENMLGNATAELGISVLCRYLLNMTMLSMICYPDPPHTTQVWPEGPLDILVNERVTLTCHAEAFPVPTYSWVQRVNTTTITRGEEQQLILDQVVFDDAGQYTCRARNPVSGQNKFSESDPFILSIAGPPHLHLEPGTVFHAVVGDNTTMELMICGEPRPDVKWLVGRNDSQVSLHAGTWHDRLHAENLVEMTSHAKCYITRLRIQAATNSDTNIYHVVVNNIHGTEVLALYLIVEGE